MAADPLESERVIVEPVEVGDPGHIRRQRFADLDGTADDGRAGRSTVGAHPENPVAAGSVGGGDVQSPVGAEHWGPQPAVTAVEIRNDDLTHEIALFGEFEDPQRLRLQRSHRESSFPLRPLGALQEDGPRWSPGWGIPKTIWPGGQMGTSPGRS